MEDLKYLSIDDLERFIIHLRNEIDHLKRTMGNNLYVQDGEMKPLAQRTLEDSESMLVHAEAEILERTLLGKS